MKKIFLILLCVVFLAGCATGPRLTTMENFDKTTFEKIDYSDANILGEVKVTSILPLWETFSATDKKAKQIMEKLEKKALKKYGKNIRLIDVNISEKNGLGNGLLYGTGTAAYLFGASGLDPETEDFKSPAYPILTVGGMTTFFFKVVTSTATVIEADTPLKTNNFTLVTLDEVEKERKAYDMYEERLARQERLAEEARLAEQERLAEEARLAEEKAQAEATIQAELDKLKKRALANNSPITIINKYIYDVNSADGVSIKIQFQNISNKTMKYINFELIPINRVFDEVQNLKKTATITDFIFPADIVQIRTWKNIWYNSTLSYFKITKITVTFTDNSEIVIDNPDVIEEISFSSSELKSYLAARSVLAEPI